MNKGLILSKLKNEYGLSKEDAHIILEVALSSHTCEIEFPPEVTEEQRAHYLRAYEWALEQVELADTQVSQLTETLLAQAEQPMGFMENVLAEVQREAGEGVSVEELGLRWGKGKDMDKDQFLSFICRLYSSFLKTKRIKAFLEWAIADAVNMSHSIYGNKEEIIDAISASFGIGRNTILRLCKTAKEVPVYMRIPGWTYKQYEVVIRYAPALNQSNFYSTMKRLAKGREMEFTLSNGAQVKSLTPLNERQVEEIILKELKVKKKRRNRKSNAGYLYLTPAGPQYSQRLDKKAMQTGAVKIIDLGRKSLVMPDGVRVSLPEYDPSVTDFFLM